MPKPSPAGEFYCPRCDRSYLTYEDMKTHMSEAHPDMDPPEVYFDED